MSLQSRLWIVTPAVGRTDGADILASDVRDAVYSALSSQLVTVHKTREDAVEDMATDEVKAQTPRLFLITITDITE